MKIQPQWTDGLTAPLSHRQFLGCVWGPGWAHPSCSQSKPRLVLQGGNLEGDRPGVCLFEELIHFPEENSLKETESESHQTSDRGGVEFQKRNRKQKQQKWRRISRITVYHWSQVLPQPRPPLTSLCIPERVRARTRAREKKKERWE